MNIFHVLHTDSLLKQVELGEKKTALKFYHHLLQISQGSLLSMTYYQQSLTGTKCDYPKALQYNRDQ